MRWMALAGSGWKEKEKHGRAQSPHSKTFNRNKPPSFLVGRRWTAHGFVLRKVLPRGQQRAAQAAMSRGMAPEQKRHSHAGGP